MRRRLLRPNDMDPLVRSALWVQQLFTKTGVRSRTQLVRIAVVRFWKEMEEE